MLLFELKNINRSSLEQRRLQEIFRFFISFGFGVCMLYKFEYLSKISLTAYIFIFLSYLFFFHNHVWKLGAILRDFALPSHIATRGFFSILLNKIFWLVGIQLIFCISFLSILVYLTNFINI